MKRKYVVIKLCESMSKFSTMYIGPKPILSPLVIQSLYYFRMMINKLYLFLCHSLGLYYMYKRLFKFAADNKKLTLYFPVTVFLLFIRYLRFI